MEIYTLKDLLDPDNKIDMMTPGRFEDAASHLCKAYVDTDPNLFRMLMLGLMEQALVSAGYEKGCKILEQGMKDAEELYSSRKQNN